MPRSKPNSLLKTTCCLAVLVLGARSLPAQMTESQFIDSVNTAVTTFQGQLSPKITNPPQRVSIGANLAFAYGTNVAQQCGSSNSALQSCLDYIDGLKAAGVQFVEFNPGVTTVDPNNPNDPNLSTYDVLVRHIHQLGLELGINPEYERGETKCCQSFQDFQTQAVAEYTLFANRYHPDHFVIVHEPDTMTGRLGFKVSNSQWLNFVTTVGPLIKQASPYTLIGAGAFYNSASTDFNNEVTFFGDFAAMPTCPPLSSSNVTTGCLDFVTMDIYSTDFNIFTGWANLAHQNGKGVYIEEFWAPHYLTGTPPAGESLDDASTVGPVSSDFELMDVNWINVMMQFASAYQMDGLTAFTTEAFFALGGSQGSNTDKPSDSAYRSMLISALQSGKLSPVGAAYQAASQTYGLQEGVSLSSASFATFPTVFDPTCGSGGNPCNANTTIAPDSLVSAFGVDLATTTMLDGTFPTTLGGTSMTLVDSSGTSFQVPIYFVAPGQVNYYVPGNAARGPATVTFTSGDGTTSKGFVLILPEAPGLYTADQNGQGVPAAVAVCAGVCPNWPNPSNGQFFQNVFNCGSSGCTAVPLKVASGDTVVVELYGTGIRHQSPNAVINATINGQNLPVLYAGTQGQFTGLDQVNIQIPSSLSGSGQVNLQMTLTDPSNDIGYGPVPFNTVTLNIE
jgi:uncharacterized protein (TIGR03437 family)